MIACVGFWIYTPQVARAQAQSALVSADTGAPPISIEGIAMLLTVIGRMNKKNSSRIRSVCR